MDSVAELHQFFREFDSQHCPVAKRQREMREERERARRKEIEAREQQRRAANISQEQWDQIDERSRQMLQLYSDLVFGEDSPHTRDIDGAFKTTIDTLRGEINAAKNQLREKFDAAVSKLHDEIARLPLEVRTWEPIGEAFDQIRQHEQARSELQTAVTTLGDKIAMLRDELNAATSKLQERLARLPLVKTWDENEISYCGDAVTHDGNLYQARKDTGKEPPHRDWILLARAGRDGLHGCTPRFRDVFNAYEQYQHRDIVTCDGNCYIACRDNPGLPGHDERWKILARCGGRGPAGEVGPRGRKGERGARGEDAPMIITGRSTLCIIALCRP